MAITGVNSCASYNKGNDIFKSKGTPKSIASNFLYIVGVFLYIAMKIEIAPTYKNKVNTPNLYSKPKNAKSDR